MPVQCTYHLFPVPIVSLSDSIILYISPSWWYVLGSLSGSNTGQEEYFAIIAHALGTIL